MRFLILLLVLAVPVQALSQVVVLVHPEPACAIQGTDFTPFIHHPIHPGSFGKSTHTFTDGSVSVFGNSVYEFTATISWGNWSGDFEVEWKDDAEWSNRDTPGTLTGTTHTLAAPSSACTSAHPENIAGQCYRTDWDFKRSAEFELDPIAGHSTGLYAFASLTVAVSCSGLN